MWNPDVNHGKSLSLLREETRSSSVTEWAEQTKDQIETAFG